MSEQPPALTANPVRGGIIGWFAHNHVAANLLMFFIISMGLYGAFTITVETFPNFEFDNIEVQVPYRGAAPAEVEEGVVVKIEEAIQDIEGIKQVFGYAREGSGRVSIEVRDGFDAAAVLDEVKLAIDSISTFPVETERPIISKAKFRQEAITVQVSGDMDERDMKNLAERIRDEIMALDEVSYAEVRGSRPFEISVQIPEITLRQYGLTLDQVALAIRAWSVDLPGGSIRSEGGNIRLRTKGQAYTGEEFERIVLISREDGTRIRLGDIATIEDAFAETESYAFFNGKRSFGIAVMSTEDENELDVTAAVRAYVEEAGAAMPPGVKMESWGDVSQHLESRMNMMFKNMFIGAILVFAILGLFLHLKFAFWVIVGLPVAFLGALMMLPLPAIGISINVISVFGFILVLGIVVDDAIVVAESVYAETEREGYSTANIVAGARRVAVPATFGVLTTIMAFLPMLFTGGALAALTGSVGWVVVLCLAFSLVESKLILPSHLAIMRSSHVSGSGRGPAEVVDRWLKDFIDRRYKPMLNLAIRHRYTTLSLFLGLLILTVSLVLGGKVRYVFFPEVEQDMLAANLELYDGAPESLVTSVVERMNGALGRVNDQLKAEAGTDGDIIKNVFTYIRDGRFGYFFVELAGGEDREVTPQAVEQRWRSEVGEIPGARELRFMSTMHMGGGPPIDFKLAGRDFRQLERAAADLEEHLAGFDGVFEIQVSANAGPEEVRLAIKPEAEASGLTLQELGRQVRTAFYGAEAQRIQRGDQEVRVMVRYPRSERQSLGNLENMWVRTPDGRELPFAAVAEYALEQGYDSIQRVDGQRSIPRHRPHRPEHRRTRPDHQRNHRGLHAAVARTVSRHLDRCGRQRLRGTRRLHPGSDRVRHRAVRHLRPHGDSPAIVPAAADHHGRDSVRHRRRRVRPHAARPCGQCRVDHGHHRPLRRGGERQPHHGRLREQGRGFRVKPDRSGDSVRRRALPRHPAHLADHLLRADTHGAGNQHAGADRDTHGRLGGLRHPVRNIDHPRSGAVALRHRGGHQGADRASPAGGIGNRVTRNSAPPSVFTTPHLANLATFIRESVGLALLRDS